MLCSVVSDNSSLIQTSQISAENKRTNSTLSPNPEEYLVRRYLFPTHIWLSINITGLCTELFINVCCVWTISDAFKKVQPQLIQIRQQGKLKKAHWNNSSVFVKCESIKIKSKSKLNLHVTEKPTEWWKSNYWLFYIVQPDLFYNSDPCISVMLQTKWFNIKHMS